jgi:branched-chain amino acid transport system permease protein
MTERLPEVAVERGDRLSRTFTAALFAAIALLALVPFFFTPDTTVKLTALFVLVILAAMWNALAGFGGLVSIGQQAFIGIGAYATIFFAERGVNGYVAVVLAALLAGLISLPTSLLVFRLRGGQFAIGMWVVAEAFRLLVVSDDSLGGGTGRSLTALNVYAPATRQAYTYWVGLALMAILLAAVVFMLRGRIGTALQAIRDDETAAASVGVRVAFGKRMVFLLAAVGCGAAGAVTVANTLTIQPNSIFGVQWTAYMIFMVLIGGLGTFEGPIIGAILLFLIQEQFADQGAWYLIGLGMVAVVVTLVLPRGLWGTVVDRSGIRLVPVGYRLRGIGGGDRDGSRPAPPGASREDGPPGGHEGEQRALPASGP